MHLFFARQIFPLTRCNFGFGATFWRLCPTVRTGQVHISRAFMCANTRPFYLSPNMRAARSSRAHSRLPWFPPKYWPLPSWLVVRFKPLKNAPLLRSFSLAFLGLSIHAWGNRPVQLRVGGFDKTINRIGSKTSTAIYDWCTSLFFKGVFLIFSTSNPSRAPLPPPPTKSQFYIYSRKHFLRQPS